MEAPQGVKLTGTNRSEILTTLNRNPVWHWKFFSVQLSHRDRLELRLVIAVGDQVSGVHSGGVPPVPIPNTAVKPASANDSRTAGSLESRSAPDLIERKARCSNAAGFLFAREVNRAALFAKPHRLIRL